VTTSTHDGADRTAPAARTGTRFPAQRAGSDRTAGPRSGRRGLSGAAWLILPPLGAFIVGNLLYLVAAHRGGHNYLDPATHRRFDARLYEEIAQHGYQVFRCGDVPRLAQMYGPDAWCGNAGWFPFYPWATRAVHAVTPWDWATAALIATQLATLAMFVLLWWLLLRVLPAPVVSGAGRWGPAFLGSRHLAVLALGLFAPAGVYFFANFPMSWAVAGMLAYLGLLARRRWVWAGVAGAVAAMSYPVAGAVVVAGLLALAVLAGRGEVPGWRRLTGAAFALGGLPAAGLLAVLAYQKMSAGYWDGYFKIQSHYQGIGHNPLANFFHLVVDPRVPRAAGDGRRADLLRFVSIAEMWVALGLVVLAVVAARIGALQGRLAAVDVGLAALAPVMFLVPLVVGVQITQYRSHLLMLPAVLVLRHLPGWLLWPLAPCLAALAYWMGTLYFPSILF
jgi:hypothetical protein